jgi:hypothetical protein
MKIAEEWTGIGHVIPVCVDFTDVLEKEARYLGSAIGPHLRTVGQFG